MLPSNYKHQEINPSFSPAFEALAKEHLTKTLSPQVIDLMAPFRSVIKQVAQHPATVSDYEIEVTHAFGVKGPERIPHFFKGVNERLHTSFFWITVGCFPGLVEQFGGTDAFADVMGVVEQFNAHRKTMSPDGQAATRFLLSGTDRSIDFQLIAQYVHEALMASTDKLKATIIRNGNEFIIALSDPESDFLATIGFPITETGNIPYTPTWGNGAPMFTDRNPRPAGMTDEEVLYLITKAPMSENDDTTDQPGDEDEDLPMPAELINPGKLGEDERDLDQAQALASDSQDVKVLREEQGLTDDPADTAHPFHHVIYKGENGEPDVKAVQATLGEGQSMLGYDSLTRVMHYAVTVGPLAEEFQQSGLDANDVAEVANWLLTTGYVVEQRRQPNSNAIELLFKHSSAHQAKQALDAAAADNVKLVRPVANADGTMSYVLSAQSPEEVLEYLMSAGITFDNDAENRSIVKVTLDESDPDPQGSIARIIGEINLLRNPK